MGIVDLAAPIDERRREIERLKGDLLILVDIENVSLVEREVLELDE